MNPERQEYLAVPPYPNPFTMTCPLGGAYKRGQRAMETNPRAETSVTMEKRSNIIPFSIFDFSCLVHSKEICEHVS